MNIENIEIQSQTTETHVQPPKPTRKYGKDAVEYQEIQEREPVEISIRSMLQAGVHFGHQTSRWDPKMASFIHSTKNGIHIINLPKTLQYWQVAREAIVSLAARGGNVLFVGTKKQAQESIVEEARRSGAYYVSHRWLGGMITNFQTIRKSIERMKKVEQMLAEEEKALASGVSPRYTKKERLMMSRELEKLEFSMGGIREMHRPPDMLFIVDVKREDIAVKEAKRLDIPVVALVDTNCDPTHITYPIPSNDDGSRAIRLFTAGVCDAVREGRKQAAAKGFSQSNEKPDVEVSKVDHSFGSQKYETDSQDKDSGSGSAQ